MCPGVTASSRAPASALRHTAVCFVSHLCPPVHGPVESTLTAAVTHCLDLCQTALDLLLAPVAWPCA